MSYLDKNIVVDITSMNIAIEDLERIDKSLIENKQLVIYIAKLHCVIDDLQNKLFEEQQKQ